MTLTMVNSEKESSQESKKSEKVKKYSVLNQRFGGGPQGLGKY